MTVTHESASDTGEQRRERAVAPAVPALPAEPHRRTLAALRIARAAGRPFGAQETTLGTGFLGIAATTLAVLLLLFDVGRFAIEWHSYPSPGLAAIAWLLLAGLLVVLAITARKAGDALPPWIGGGIMAGLAVVVALDVAAVWRTSGNDLGRDLTAAPATALVLLAMVGVRSARSIILAAVVLGVGLLALVLVSWGTAHPTGDAAEAAAAMIGRAIAPPIVAAVIVTMFRRVVSRELERVLIGSTVSAPRMSVGMLASEELARLDLAAEQLLDDVATGRSRLPLNPESAQAAAELATELRLHLIEGRRQTWLYHAISESDLLGRTVSLSDPDSLAGLLDQRQRDGLLQTAWLLLGDSPERSRRSALRLAVDIRIGPLKDAEAKRMHVPILLRTTGVPRNRVDPTAWDAMRKVGRHSEVQRSGGSFSVEIDALVDRPADR